MLLRCLDRSEDDSFTTNLHEGACRGHKYWKATTFKILRVGYYWPTLFTDVYAQVKSCMQYQNFVGKTKVQYLPLKPIAINASFQQWGLDFIGEINPPSSGKQKWILTTTDFFTKWVEAIPTRRATNKVNINFLQ